MVTLVSNSIGTISSLQAVIDRPELFKGVFVVSPNFRELHSAEIPFPQFSMPIIRIIQKLLRERGQGLFDALAKPNTVKQILKEPYAIESAVDDVLVDALANSAPHGGSQSSCL
jgi:pimeloyl-ACP methyl ester carboxylesterase